MNKTNSWLLLGLIILVAAAAGFGLVAFLGPDQKNPYSETARLALDLPLAEEEKTRVLALDETFRQAYADYCGLMCGQRAELSSRLTTAAQNDPEVQQLAAAIHTTMAGMELLTANHILKIRDLLPAAQGKAFILAVQLQWAEGQAKLAAIAKGACQTDLGEGSP